MAEWSRDKVETLNNGKEYEKLDRVSREQINAIINNSFYGVDFVEAMADTPDLSEVSNIGVPNVTIINNIKNGKIYKKFKFSNLKGEKGDKGDPGIELEYDSSTRTLNIITE